MFCPLVTILGKCMATRYTAYGEGLWRAAAAVFNSIVNCGLPAVNIAYNDQEGDPPKAAWACLAEVFDWFLLGTRVVALDTVATAEVLDAVAAADAAAASDNSEVTASASLTATPVAAASTSEAAPSPDGAFQPPAEAAASDSQTSGSVPVTAPVDAESQSQAAASVTRPSSDASRADVTSGSSPQPAPSTSKPPSKNPSRRSSRNPSRDPSFSATLGDTEQSSSDAELEASVVDTLTDAVLTSCSHAPEDIRRRFIGVLDQAITRPKDRHIPNSAAGKLDQMTNVTLHTSCHGNPDRQCDFTAAPPVTASTFLHCTAAVSTNSNDYSLVSSNHSNLGTSTSLCECGRSWLCFVPIHET